MSKKRVCVNWVDGEDAKEKAFLVDMGKVADSFRVRKFELSILKDCWEDPAIYLTTKDGEDTLGYYEWSVRKKKYIYHELDG